MSLVALLCRRGLRRDWRGWAFVSALTAITVAAAAGATTVAWQTIDAHPRLFDAVDAPDLTVGIGSPDDPGPPAPIPPEELRGLEGVADMRVVRHVVGTEVDADGQPDLTFRTGLVVAVDGAPALPLQRGRWPSPDAADEVAISTDAVGNLGVDIGDHLRYLVATASDQQITPVDPVVVGVFGPVEVGDSADDPTGNSLIVASGSFLDRHPGIGTYQQASLWLEDGVRVETFLRSLEDRFGSIDVSTRTQVASKARRAVRPEALAMLGLGAASALVGLIVTSMTVARLLNDRRDDLAYHALGLTRYQRALQRWLQASIAIAAGVVLGLVGALVVARRLGPIGVADAFEQSGLSSSDIGVAGGVVALLAGLLAIVAALSSWRGSRLEISPSPPLPPPAWVAAIVRAAPTSVRTGAALAGRGTGAHLAVRAAVVGTSVSMAVGVTVIAFTSSLDALVSTPAYYGADYDLSTWDGYGRIDDDTITAALTGDADVVGIARSSGSTGTVDGREAGLSGYDDFTIGPSLTSGVAPVLDDEVVLGRRLAHRLGVAIDDEVSVVVGADRATYRVVGVGVLPGATGDGAAFTLEGLQRVAPDAEVGNQYARLRPGADVDGVVAHYGEAIGCPSNCDIVEPSPPPDLAYLARVGDLPRWSVGAVIVLGVAMSIHALLVVGRRSRRSIAILRSMGATGRQVVTFVLWQGLLVVVPAMCVGAVAGVLLGRAVWGRFAAELGVVDHSTTSPAAIALSMGILATLTIVTATLPGWRGAGRPIAVELRAE